jgi:hypothetical protein
VDWLLGSSPIILSIETVRSVVLWFASALIAVIPVYPALHDELNLLAMLHMRPVYSTAADTHHRVVISQIYIFMTVTV